jgi:6-phosphogluconolactonase
MLSAAAVFVSNADSKDISVLKLDRGKGSIELLQSVDTDGMVMPLAVGPDKRFVYAAIRSEPFNVASYAIDAETGRLTKLGTAPLPHSMASITTDRTGRWLFAASYPGHLISVSPIGADGLAREPIEVIPTGKNAHAVVLGPGNRTLLVTNLGSDQVLQFRFDAATGKLTPADPASFRTRKGAGPRHIAIHPDGKHAYLLHELDATVDLLAFDSKNGTLSLMKTWNTLPPESTARPWAADLHLTPDGNFLYTSERNSHTLAIWKVHPTNGQLSLVGHQPTEAQPRGFQIDSTGQWLLAVGQVSNHLTAYRIDPETGKLTPAARLPLGENPNWVEIVDLA